MSAQFSGAIPLLLHFNGSNGSTTFTDSSLLALTVTRSNNAQISTAQSKFGGASALFAGNGSPTASGDYLTTATSPFLSCGSGDFTHSFWFRMAALPSTFGVLLDGRPSLTNGTYITLSLDPSGVLIYYTSAADRITGGPLSTGVWYYIELCRVNGVTRLFIDGVQAGSSYTDTASYADTRFVIGASGYHTGPVGQYGLNGNIDDLRLLRGIGLHSATFTPPAAPHDDPGIDAKYTLFSTLPKVVGPTLSFPAPGATGKTVNATPLRPNTKPLLIPVVPVEFFGKGTIKGTVKVITTPAPSRKVRLYDKVSGKLARETISDGSGLYGFTNLDKTRTYYVTAFDNAGGYNATIEDSVTPA
jgi:hypothetical protein